MKLKRNIRLILNIRLIIRIYGFIVLLTGIAMLPAVAAAFIYGENTIGKAFLFTSIFAVLVSALTILFVKPHNHYLRTRDGFFIVGFGWILVCLVGCIPYLASGYTASFCSAFLNRLLVLPRPAQQFLISKIHRRPFFFGKPFLIGWAAWEFSCLLFLFFQPLEPAATKSLKQKFRRSKWTKSSAKSPIQLKFSI